MSHRTRERDLFLRMMARALLPVLICLPVLGCAMMMRPPHPIYYYVLEYPLPPAAHDSPLPAVLRVSRFSAAAPYGSDRMFHASMGTGRQAYTFHQWRARPPELIESLILRDLRESGSFAGVFPAAHRMGTTHAIEAVLESFYQKESGARMMAVMEIAVTLVSENEPDPIKRVIYQKRYREEEPMVSAEPRYFAEAMSRAMARISEAIRTDAVRELKPQTHTVIEGGK